MNSYGTHFKAVTVTGGSNHTGVTRFAGFSIREAAGAAAAAAVNFRDGSVTGQILWVLELAADESAGVVFGGSFATPDGVYVEVVSGTIAGILLEQI